MSSNNGLKAEIVSIGPAQASTLLAHNDRNRNVNPRRVNQYAEAMSEGMWSPGVAQIVVDRDGEIVNGQHTLAAIAQSGIAVDVTLVTGVVADDARPSIDIGMTRRLGHELQLRGIQNANSVAAIARMAEAMEQGAGWGYGKGGAWGSRTPRLIIAWIAAHPQIHIIARESESIRKATGLAVSATGTFIFQAQQVDDSGLVEQFLAALKTGESLEGGSPILALRHWRSVRRTKFGTGHNLTSSVQLAAITTAWNAWIEHRPVSKIGLRPDYKFPTLVAPDHEPLVTA